MADSTGMRSTRKLYVGRRETWAFYLAALMRDMSYALVGGFLLLFYVDIMGFAGTAALIFIPIITRIWDGINDPLLGIYFDRQNYTTEKAGPIFKATVLTGAIMLVLMFFAPSFSRNPTVDYLLKCVYAVLTYGIFEAIQTLNGTAFMSLYSSISPNPDERTKIISISRLFSMIGTGIIGALFPFLLGLFRNDDIRAKTYIYLGTAVFVALCFIIYNFLMHHFVQERMVSPPPQRQKILPMIKRFFQNKMLLLMITSSLLANFLNIGTIQIYFYTYNLGSPAFQTLVYIFSIPTFVLGTVLVPQLTKKFNKRDLMIAANLMLAAFYGFYLLAGFRPPLWLAIVILPVFTALPEAVHGTLYWNMVADSVDYAEWKTGFRNDGMIYSIEGAAMKIIGGIGAMFTGIVVAVIHFVPNALVQSQSTMKGLFYIPVLAVIVTRLLCIIPSFSTIWTGRSMRRY